MIGTTLGHYRVLEKLGEGGMGVVYKAQDLHLDRPVALKVLPAEKVADPDRKRRFVQEAKAASALNHPHIVHIYDIDQSDGTDFIAMEYVEGQTLDQRIGHRGMRLNDALKYAVQIADALAKAHAAGIVHRDLKPTNIIVSADGVVKVLDFGLAKLTEPDVSDVAATATVHAEAKPLTEAGVILGTVAYMSPEQAEGTPVDARSDIFSLGSVLYEMVTGQQAFQGKSRMSTLSAILHGEPKPASGITPAIPIELERLITRCLRKDPAKRFQHMDDLKVALEELKEESDSGKLATAAGRVARPGFRWGGVAALAVAAVVLVVAGWLWVARSRVAPAEAPSAAIPLTSFRGSELDPSFSPDGRMVAFAWDGEKGDNFDIYVKQIDSQLSPAQRTTNPARDSNPAWSPDGQSIAFLRQEASGAVIVLTPPIGGGEQRRAVGDVQPVRSRCGQLSWRLDGKWLAFGGLAQGSGERLSIWAVHVDTGERRRLTTPQKIAQGTAAAASDSCPSFSPDGHWLAFARNQGGTVSDVYKLRLGEDLQPAGEPVRVTSQRFYLVGGIAWTAGGRELVYSAGDSAPSLWRVPVFGDEPPHRLYSNATCPAVSVKADLLAYSELIRNSGVWRLDTRTGESTKLFGFSGTISFAQYSPDGRKIAFQSDRSGYQEIHACDADGSHCQQLTTFSAPLTGTPRWSPDGLWLAFDSRKEGQADIYVVSADGGEPRRVTRSTPFSHEMPTWSGDGKWIFYQGNRSGSGEIWKVPAAGGEEARVTHSGGGGPFVSPDGRCIYYVKNSSLFRMPVAGGEEQPVLPPKVSVYAYTVSLKGVYFPSDPYSKAPVLQFLNLATGKVRTLAPPDPSEGLAGLSVSPDDRYVIGSQLDPDKRVDLKLIEHFR